LLKGRTAKPETNNHRPDVSSVHSSPSRSRKNMVGVSRSSSLHSFFFSVVRL
jgi:hypothetical protein